MATLELLPLDHESLKEEWQDLSTLKRLVCKNHPDGGQEYLTKNPWSRSLHLVGIDPNMPINSAGSPECNCPFSDLRYVVKS